MTPARERQMTKSRLLDKLLLNDGERFANAPQPGPEPLEHCFVRGPMTDEAYARYFAERETAERTMSYRARNWRVAAIHSELAERYEALAKVFGAKR
jgi:hypothetical protein